MNKGTGSKYKCFRFEDGTTYKSHVLMTRQEVIDMFAKKGKIVRVISSWGRK